MYRNNVALARCCTLCVVYKIKILHFYEQIQLYRVSNNFNEFIGTSQVVAQLDDKARLKKFNLATPL